MKLLLRYLLREVTIPLVTGAGFLFLILFVMQFLRGTEVLLGSAVTLRDFGLLTLYLAPHFLVMALPIAFLLAILLGLGRLNEDRELTALQSLGVRPWQIVSVPLLLGAVVSALTLVLSFNAEPWGLSAVRGVVNEVIKKNLVGDVKSGVFYEDLTNLTLYAEKVEKAQGRWSNVLLYDDRDPASPLLVLAREGQVNPAGSGEALKLTLFDGHVHRANTGNSDYVVLGFERAEIAVGVTESILRKNRFRAPRQELTPGELLEAARETDERGEDGTPFRMAFHWRWGQVFTPLAFALWGAPLAMGRRQSGRARGYLLTVGGYIVYYVLARTFENLGIQGKLPLLVAGQLANLIFAAIGAVALWRVSRVGMIR